MVGDQGHTPASVPPGKTRYPLYRRLGGPECRPGQVRKISAPSPGFDPRTVQPVASRYTDNAIPALISRVSILEALSEWQLPQSILAVILTTSCSVRNIKSHALETRHMSCSGSLISHHLLWIFFKSSLCFSRSTSLSRHQHCPIFLGFHKFFLTARFINFYAHVALKNKPRLYLNWYLLIYRLPQ